jgi:O-antigen ligase
MEENSAAASGPFPHLTRRTGELFVVLSGVLSAVSFWSTALAELGGVLLLLVAAIHLLIPMRRGMSLMEGQGLLRVALLLWGVYVAALLVSILVSAAPLFPRVGLLWHPLLFPAALLVPLSKRGLRAAGILLLLGGAASATVTLALNFMRGQGGAPFTFTGLTTFADLLVLAGTVAFSLLFPRGRPGSPVWRFAVPCVMIALALVWTSERVPVLILAAVGSARVAAAGPRPLAAWVVIAGACLLLGPPALADKMEWLIRGNPVDRYVVWEEGLKQIPDTPLFGHGPGSYPQVLPAGVRSRFINRAPSSWHNDILETWLDSGPLAAGAFGGLLFIGVLRGVRNLFRREEGVFPPGWEPGLLFLCLASFGLVGSVVTTSVLGLAFWLLLGLTLHSRTERALTPTGVPRSS